MAYIGPLAAIVAGSVSNTELSNISQYILKGRVSAGSGSPEDLTADQAITLLNQASSSTLNAARVASYYRTILANGSTATQRPQVNFLNGTGITVSAADDAVNSKTELTVGLATVATARILGNNSGSTAAPTALDGDGVLGVINASGTATLNNNRLAALSPSPAGTFAAATVTVDAQGRVTNATAGSGFAYLATAQSFTAAQRGSISALTDGATITPDFAVANNFSVTLGGNRTLANPTNLTAGQSGVIVISQDSSGSRTASFGGYWKFPGGTAPTLTTTASAKDVLCYFVDSSTRITARLISDVK
jgi:hypothetical protein